jgi:hypothetical protein
VNTVYLSNRITGSAAVIIYILAFHAFGQNAQQPGMYYEQDGKPVALTPAAYSGTQVSNKVVKANVSWTFRSAHSPLQLATNHPHFRLVCGYGAVPVLILCQPGSFQPNDLIVIQLDEKSDHRESRMASGSMLGGHGGFDPKKTVTTVVAKQQDGSWDISPTQDLKPGEYLVTTGMSPQGFDFGIQKQQK